MNINFNSELYKMKEYRFKLKKEIEKRKNSGENVIMPFPLTLTVRQALGLWDEIHRLRDKYPEFKEAYDEAKVVDFKCHGAILWFISSPFVPMLSKNKHIKKHFLQLSKRRLSSKLNSVLDPHGAVGDFIYAELNNMDQ